MKHYDIVITEMPLVLEFRIKNAVSLKELNLGNDTRKLGIGFKSMKIEEVKDNK